MSEWISVKDRLPEDGTRVLVAYGNGDVGTSMMESGGFYVEKHWKVEVRDITHWMALPEPPVKGISSAYSMDTLSTFARRFRELRKSAGLKQAEIGDILGVSRGTISFYENTDRTPDIVFAAKAAGYFQVSTDYLLGLTGVRSAQPDVQAAAYTGLST